MAALDTKTAAAGIKVVPVAGISLGGCAEAIGTSRLGGSGTVAILGLALALFRGSEQNGYMSGSTERVLGYYSLEPGKEWRRLAELDTGPIEFELTTRLLARYVAPDSRVLDIGGGPGRYAIWLAERRLRVTLADIVPALLAEAGRRIEEAGVQVDAIVEADVCDLSRWATGFFDAVLCLGPFYHLPERERREQAARELARVVRSGGVLFAAFMPRLGFLRRSIAVPDEWVHLRDPEFVRSVLDDGAFLNDSPGRFDAGYGALPEEIVPFFDAVGFEAAQLLAAESFAPAVSEELASMARDDPEAFAAALDILETTAAESSILGAANHLLYIGRRS